MVKEEPSSSVTSSPLQLFSYLTLSPGLGSPFPLLRELKSEETGLCLIQLLVACANHVASGNLENANIGLEHISHLASPDGDTVQRIAAYFSNALADRMLKAWPGLHKALNSTKIKLISDEILAQKLFFELCPFLKLAYVITNQAILEAMEGERMVHIIDLNCTEPAQWINLLKTLSARPEGPPHLRITGIHEHKEVLELMFVQLTEEAEKLDIPFQFNPVVSKLDNLDLGSLRVKTGEALAITSVLRLHSVLATNDEMIKSSASTSAQSQRILSITPQSPRERLEKVPTNIYGASPDSVSPPLTLPYSPEMGNFLTSLWGLSPKLMVVTEQESNHNTTTFMERVMEALNYYAALFDCLESTVSRTSIERQKVEKILFGEEIKNIIACEGVDRKERHEKLEKWILRLEMAGFGRVPFSFNVLLQAKRFLQSYNYEGYEIRDDKGFLAICWHDRPLFSVSAWRFRRFES